MTASIARYIESDDKNINKYLSMKAVNNFKYRFLLFCFNHVVYLWRNVFQHTSCTASLTMTIGSKKPLERS